ncbi:MAG: hypothetical protein AB1601_05445 [Planctomycetota bacterium]
MVAAWPALPELIRRAVLALVGAVTSKNHNQNPAPRIGNGGFGGAVVRTIQTNMAAVTATFGKRGQPEGPADWSARAFAVPSWRVFFLMPAGTSTNIG